MNWSLASDSVLAVGFRSRPRPVLEARFHWTYGSPENSAVPQARVGKFPVGIAPLAVRLVEGAIRLPADAGVLQGHTATLTDHLPG